VGRPARLAELVSRDPQVVGLAADVNGDTVLAAVIGDAIGFDPIASRQVDSHNPSHRNRLRVSRGGVSPPLPTDSCQTDPDLATINEAWPSLPEAIKAGILAIVRAAAKHHGMG
jgi:hypothetical protein